MVQNWAQLNKVRRAFKVKKKTETEGKSKLRRALMPSSTVDSGPHDLLVIRTVSNLIKWLAMRNGLGQSLPYLVFDAMPRSHKSHQEHFEHENAAIENISREQTIVQLQCHHFVTLEMKTCGNAGLLFWCRTTF